MGVLNLTTIFSTEFDYIEVIIKWRHAHQRYELIEKLGTWDDQEMRYVYTYRTLITPEFDTRESYIARELAENNGLVINHGKFNGEYFVCDFKEYDHNPRADLAGFTI